MAGYLGGLQAILFYCTTSRSVPQAVFTGVYYVSFLFCLHRADALHQRWGLMRNTDPENVQEHSHMVAVLAHALAVIRRDKFGGTIDPGHVAAVALYHDAPEIFTGDLPTR